MAKVPEFTGDFESGWGDWGAGRGIWQIGGSTAVTCFSGSQCAATHLNSNYHPDTDSQLTSATFQLPTAVGAEEVHLRFQQWFSYVGGDYGQVQISVQDELTGAWGGWTNVGTSIVNTSGWSLKDVELTAYAGETVRIAFYHTASRPCCSSSNYESTGWYIDDVEIESTGAPNHPPELSPTNAVTVTENDTLTIPLSATDQNIADILTFSFSGPTFITLTDNGDGAGYLTASPGFADAGTHTITVTVTDFGGLTDSQQFTLTVNDDPRAPTLAEISNQTMNEGEVLAVPVSATDPDVGEVLSLSLTGPSFITLQDNGDSTGILNIEPGFNDAGVYSSITVSVTDSSGLINSRVFSLTVNDVPPPVAVVSTTSLDFGDVLVGGSADNSVLLSNTGGSLLTVTNIESSGPPFIGFPPSSFGVDVNSDRNLAIGFMPTVEGDFSGTITITNNAGTPIVVNISGRGMLPAEPGNIVVGGNLDFGNVQETSFVEKTLTLSNTGSGPLQISSVSVDNTVFEVSTTPGDILPYVLNPDESRNLIVRFVPPAASADTSFTGILSISSDDPDAGVSQVVLSGKAVAEVDPTENNPVLGANVLLGDIEHVITADSCGVVGGQVQFGSDASSADSFVVNLVDQGGVSVSSATFASIDGAGVVSFDGLVACGLADGVVAIDVRLSRSGIELPSVPGTPAVKYTTSLEPPTVDPLEPYSLSPVIEVCGISRNDTTVRIEGGASTVSTTLQADVTEFCLPVTLRQNTENTLIVSAIDNLAPAPKPVAAASPVKIVHVDPSAIVFAEAFSRPLSDLEVDDLVQKGVINLEDASNFNVSMFTVVLTIGAFPVTVSQPVVDKPTPGSVSYGRRGGGAGGSGSGYDGWTGGGSGGGGGGGAAASVKGCISNCPQIVVITGSSGQTIPGVIIIDGRIKTLKEFFQVRLLLWNTSTNFLLSEMVASVSMPAGLTPIRAGLGTDVSEVNLSGAIDSVVLGEIAAGDAGIGQFIIRGDGIGIHNIDVNFEGDIISGGLPVPIPVSGSASTSVQVLGPPKLGVVVRHPSHTDAPDVTLDEIYDLLVEISNQSDRPARYTSLELFVGGDTLLVDTAGIPIQSASEIHDFGYIQPGETVTARFRVQSLVEGEIIACQAIAGENITLTVDTGADGTACNIVNTYPANFEPLPPEFPPTVLAINPLNGQANIPLTTSIVATLTPQTECLIADTWRNVITAPIAPSDLSKGLQVISATLMTAGTFYLEELNVAGEPIRHVPTDLSVEHPPAGGSTIGVLRLGLDLPHVNSQFFLSANTAYRVTILGGPDGVCSLTSGATMDTSFRWEFYTGESTNAPVLDDVNDQVVNEGETLSVSLTASDADLSDTLVLSASGPTFVTLIDNGDGSGFLNVKPGFNDAGSYQVTVSVTDSAGLINTKTFTLSVLHVNRAPVLDFIADQNVNESEQLLVSLSASDPDVGDALQFTLQQAQSYIELTDFGDGTAELNIQPGFDDANEYSIGVMVTDQYGLSDSQSFDLIVNNVNRAPELALIDNHFVNENETLSFLLMASDPDGNNLDFSAANLPTGAVLTTNGNGTAQFSWTPTFAQAGNFQLQFIVIDDGSPVASDSEQITITVGDVNRPPVLQLIGNRSVNENEFLSFTLMASDPDGDSVSFDVANLPTGAVLTDNDDNSAQFQWTPSYAQAGNFQLQFIVVDDGSPVASDSEQITITVGDVNRPPVLQLIGNRSVNENEFLSFTLMASDPDANNVSFDVANLPAGAILSDNNDGTAQFQWTPTYVQAGNFQLQFLINDDGSPVASDSEQITITVGDVNRPPVLQPIGNRSVNENESLSFTLMASDPDGDNVSFNVDNLPTGAVLTDNGDGTAQFQWIPTYSQADNFIVNFTVSDDGLPSESDSEQITITVGDVNRLPELQSIGNRSVNENELLAFTLIASDPDGDNLYFAVDNLQTGADFIDIGDGTAQFSWTATQSGEFSVIFSVTDDGSPSASDEEFITISVEAGGSCGGPLNPGDLDIDCDVDDRNIFRSSLGACLGDANYIAEANYDGDQCVTLGDYRIWYSYYKAVQ